MMFSFYTFFNHISIYSTIMDWFISTLHNYYKIIVLGGVTRNLYHIITLNAIVDEIKWNLAVMTGCSSDQLQIIINFIIGCFITLLTYAVGILISIHLIDIIVVLMIKNNYQLNFKLRIVFLFCVNCLFYFRLQFFSFFFSWLFSVLFLVLFLTFICFV